MPIAAFENARYEIIRYYDREVIQGSRTYKLFGIVQTIRLPGEWVG